jgi:hypothetical protein
MTRMVSAKRKLASWERYRWAEMPPVMARGRMRAVRVSLALVKREKWAAASATERGEGSRAVEARSWEGQPGLVGTVSMPSPVASGRHPEGEVRQGSATHLEAARL